MEIRYLEPLSRAWERMTVALFKPFDIKKWFLIGFTAFLAGLIDCQGNGGSGSNNGGCGDSDLSDVIQLPGRAWEWLKENPGWFLLIILGILVLMTFVAVLTWLSSRGKFMFLHNVVNDCAEVVNPWHKYRAQGDSLFLWRLCFGFIGLGIILLLIVSAFYIAYNAHERNFSKQMTVLYAIGLAFLALAIGLIAGYISLFLNDFVVPVMYKHEIAATEAWRRLIPVFSKHVLHFFFYGIFVFLLVILALIALVVAGFCTCCIGFLLMVIPYIGAVFTLPISYTLRAFSAEFLAQFGPELNVFPQPAD
ncbi:hypothetical protein ACFLU6_06850 [Acidobacteriota bacterium]